MQVRANRVTPSNHYTLVIILLLNRTMRLFNAFLIAGLSVLALPSDGTLRSNTLTLIQPLNTTSPLEDDSAPVCFGLSTYHHVPVNHSSCAALIAHVSALPHFTKIALFVPGLAGGWTKDGCKVRIADGRQESKFTLRTVVAQMQRILTTCQPPSHRGVGGIAPIAGIGQGVTDKSFDVLVTGVAQ